MAAGAVLAIYCVAVALGSIVGGWIPMFLRLTHTRMQLAISFIGGAMLGVGVLHLLPHSFMMLGSIDRSAMWLMAGFLVMFFFERMFHFHHHEAPAELQEAKAHDHHAHHHHDHHHHPADGEHCDSTCDTHDDRKASDLVGGRLSWIAALVGLSLHSVLDGVALAASVMVEAEDHGGALAGLGVFLVVFLHKPFDSMTLGALMAVAKKSRRDQWLVNGLYALAAPAGAFAFYFLGESGLGANGNSFIGAALAFAAGTFICIATSDLLPELQFHSHDRFKLSAALLLGLALAWSIVFVETSGHDHAGHGPGGAHEGHEHHEH